MLPASVSSNVYISALEPQSGKSIVSLGLMETLSRKVDRLGFFRPVISGGAAPDSQIELLRGRYRLAARYEDMYAMTDAEAARLLAAGDSAELAKRVVQAYRALERDCDFVVIEGVDFPREGQPASRDLDAALAGHLDAAVLLVLNGARVADAPASVRLAREALVGKGCSLLGVIVNRVPPARRDQVAASLATGGEEEPVYVMPER
ncbi:MAG: phosphate acetyltransferase, partial [Thermoleophilaceae bacterium]|nr:phosphate acetyltransferase [Thermoleophilaceae bacterium]